MGQVGTTAGWWLVYARLLRHPPALSAFALPKKDGSPLTMSASLTAARSMDSSSVSSSSQQRRHRKRTTTSPAMSHLSAETTWKRIQADKEREMDVLQRYYKKRANVHKQLGQVGKMRMVHIVYFTH